MPLYSFYNEETDEVTEEIMSISSMETYLKEHPHIKQIIHAPAIVSGVMGRSQTKIDSGFKDVLSRIGNANPHSPLGQEYGDKGIRATKTREVVKRQKERQAKSIS